MARIHYLIKSQAWFEIEAERILAIIRGLVMPEIGGKKFAHGFQGMLENTIRKAMVESQKIIQEAADELAEEMKAQAKGAAQAIRAETRTVREAFSPYTGNNPPEGEEAAQEPANPIPSSSEEGKAA